MTTQAVILARGMGTRMRKELGASDGLTSVQRAAAAEGAKGMMPFGRPFLDYVVSALADAGITKVVFVVAPGLNRIHEYYTTTAPARRVHTKFAVQEQARGTADAVLAARGVVDDAPFLVLNSDNYYPVEAYRALVALGGAGIVAFDAETLIRESGIERERVLKYALLDVDAAGMLRKIIEKPAADHPLAQRPERLVSMNLWSFTPRIFEACARIAPSARGELEIQDAVMLGITELGERFRVISLRAGVLDLSSRADIGFVASHLEKLDPRP